MPAKGFFTQGISVLLRQKIKLADIEPLLGEFKVVKCVETFEHWEFGGPSFVVAFRPDVNGYVSVDIVDEPWPDHMGSRQESVLFGAWAMGHFGPFAFPGSLERAKQHCYRWAQGAQAADLHQGFIRVRTSYGFGAPENAPVMPKDCNPVDELNFITHIVMELLKHPAALCCFNPNGELLAERPYMEQVLDHYRKAELPPVDLWANRRRFKLNADWMMIDTVGMQQLDVDDIETCFRRDRFDPNDIDLFLGNTSLYLTGAGPVIKEGETIDGPGGLLFRAKPFKEGIVTPPRETLRFRPEDGTIPPPNFGFGIVEKKPKWKFWK